MLNMSQVPEFSVLLRSEITAYLECKLKVLSFPKSLINKGKW